MPGRRAPGAAGPPGRVEALGQGSRGGRGSQARAAEAGAGAGGAVGAGGAFSGSFCLEPGGPHSSCPVLLCPRDTSALLWRTPPLRVALFSEESWG